VPEKVAAWEFRRWLDLNGKGWQRRELAAHNAGFDALFVLALEHRTGIDLELPKLWHCTKLKMQRLRELGVLPAKGGNRLDDLGELSGFWDLEPRAKEHDALQDARACRHGLLWLREKERGAAL
jgi:DNA polymerase III epsilon subunit-like protein